MDRQTLRDRVHRFNNQGPDGLCDVHAGGVEPRLSADKLAELAAIVEADPRTGLIIPTAIRIDPHEPSPASRLI